MEFAELLPIIIILTVLLIGVVVLVSIIIFMKKGSLKNEKEEKMNLDLKKRVETLERKIEEMNKK